MKISVNEVSVLTGLQNEVTSAKGELEGVAYSTQYPLNTGDENKQFSYAFYGSVYVFKSFGPKASASQVKPNDAITILDIITLHIKI